MNRPKLLLTTVTTAALVSAIGFSYAQTSYDNKDKSAATTQSADKTPAPSANATGGSDPSASKGAADSTSDSKSSTGTASSDSSSKAAKSGDDTKKSTGTASVDSSSHERMAKADRN